ncbi:hypothetical protein GBAR_LOCUS27004 [Geodia barretti]|uniref:Uncharacterized protein n=1 Tax=Geodia barretti TaxID=519541 RepID=A0AA35X883_GEOBA|nr:hypothetical protein GBAR_LOCUS27004 [Geodia barretti]
MFVYNMCALCLCLVLNSVWCYFIPSSTNIHAEFKECRFAAELHVQRLLN